MDDNLSSTIKLFTEKMYECRNAVEILGTIEALKLAIYHTLMKEMEKQDGNT